MKKKITLLISFALLGFGISISNTQTVDPLYWDGQLYLKVKDTSTVILDPYPGNIPALNLIISAFGVSNLKSAFVTITPPLDRIYHLDFSDTMGVNTLIAQLSLLSFVEYAEKIPIYDAIELNFIPNDIHPSQWHLININAAAAWDISTGSPTVKIAIVDNGVLISHQDLAGNIWINTGEIPNNLLDDDFNGFIDDANGYDVADLDNNPNPPPGTTISSPFVHGTHCAGIASAVTNNGIGIASIGFQSKIIPVKCSENSSTGNSISRAYEGIDYAMAAGADVISMSFGGEGTSLTGQLVIQRAAGNGIVLVGAAGNSNVSTQFYPAAYPEVIAVASTDNLDVKSGFSNYGDWVDVSAPGSGIYSTLAGNNSAYGSLSGTSMATPLVAGLAGLTIGSLPSPTAAQVRNLIESGCDNIDLQNPGYIGKLGAGRINAHKTLLTTAIEKQAVNAELFQAYPNPVKESFLIEYTGKSSGIYSLRILDLCGKILYEKEGLPANESIEIDSDLLAKGWNILTFSDGVNQVFKKLLK